MPTLSEMTPDEIERFKTQQIQALIAAGQNPIDAANQVKRFLAKVPPHADPRSYVPRDLPNEDLSSEAVLDDLRASWYGDEKVPAKMKRILDAKGVE